MALPAQRQMPQAGSYQVDAEQVRSILAYRRRGVQEQFLVAWKNDEVNQQLQNTVLSWHSTSELERCTFLLQIFLEQHFTLSMRNRQTIAARRYRNYQSPEQNESSTQDESSPEQIGLPALAQYDIFNGLLSKRLGLINGVYLQTQSASWQHLIKNGETYGRLELSRELGQMPLSAESLSNERAAFLYDIEVRACWQQMLSRRSEVRSENAIDGTVPSLDFELVESYTHGHGVESVPNADYCRMPCKPNMGRSCGCEYTYCECLALATIDEVTLKRQNPRLFDQYLKAIQAGHNFDTTNLPRRFPYELAKESRPSRLQRFYLDGRHALYECNDKCSCGPGCKTKLVQKGRQVPLTIFKTINRGWGVKSSAPLIQGQFVDTYYGEIITAAEADNRDLLLEAHENRYLFNLDKFVGDVDFSTGQKLTSEQCHVVDAGRIGGVMRFVNHSCNPNLGIFAVSWNKRDVKLYSLASFALKDIEPGTELTYDYLDRVPEGSRAGSVDNIMQSCLCGESNCRQRIWM